MEEIHKIPEYYEALAPGYDKDRFSNSYGRYIDRQERAALKRLKLHSRGHPVLDLACGTGRFTDLADCGADISPAMIAEARKKFPDKDFRIASAFATPFEDGTFAVIIAMHFVMHLNPAETDRFLLECARILRPGGVLIFDFPSSRRRKRSGRKNSGWHGDNAFSLAEIRRHTAKDWSVRSWQGILFFPIHRVHRRLRSGLRWLDTLCCRSPWREWSSYLIIEMEKK